MAAVYSKVYFNTVLCFKTLHIFSCKLQDRKAQVDNLFIINC